MRQSDKYHVAAIVYDLTRCTFAFSYRLRSSLMRRKWCARIVACAFVNAKIFGIVTLEVVHCSIPSFGLRPKYNTFARDSARQS